MDIHNNLGDLWRAQGQMGKNEAQQCYMTALRLDQSYAPAWRGLGDLYREMGDNNNAVHCYQVGLLHHSSRHIQNTEGRATQIHNVLRPSTTLPSSMHNYKLSCIDQDTQIKALLSVPCKAYHSKSTVAFGLYVSMPPMLDCLT